MLTKDCFLPSFIHLSQPASFLTAIGFYWDKGREKVVKLSPRSAQFHKISVLLQTVSLIITLLQTALSPENNLSTKMISSFGLIIICFCTATVRVYHMDMAKCISLINDLVETAKEMREPGKPTLDTKEKLIKFLAPAFHWSAMAVPFAFVIGVVWSMPCMSSNFGYFLLRQCNPSLEETYQNFGGMAGHVETLVKAFFLASNLLLWSYSVQGAVFVVIGVIMLGAMSIRSFLKHYQRKMLKVMEGSHRQQKSLLKNALIYRRLQLLTARFNRIHQLRVLVPLLFTVTSHQVFSVFGAIKFKGQLNFASYALFGILGSQGVMVIMGMFTALGDVYSMSVQVKRTLEKKHRSHKWLRRFHSACPIIKIRFGTLNYIDSFSPLAFENFAIMQTANILLV